MVNWWNFHGISMEFPWWWPQAFQPLLAEPPQAWNCLRWRCSCWRSSWHRSAPKRDSHGGEGMILACGFGAKHGEKCWVYAGWNMVLAWFFSMFQPWEECWRSRKSAETWWVLTSGTRLGESGNSMIHSGWLRTRFPLWKDGPQCIKGSRIPQKNHQLVIVYQYPKKMMFDDDDQSPKKNDG